MLKYIKDKIKSAIMEGNKERVRSLAFYVGFAVVFLFASIVVGAGMVRVFEMIKSLF